nr:MAG TPA: hypothetical protein [Caudoviricetes sp.]DAW88506.1 MAG TPA: hypothetical protein [Caudoviricetes sp.]
MLFSIIFPTKKHPELSRCYTQFLHYKFYHRFL